MASALEKLMRENPMLAKGVIYQSAAEKSLYEFIKLTWSSVEPGRDFRPAKHIEAICEHLEAVASGDIRKILINIPPGFAKALCHDTPVLTTWGWKKHGDLLPGDFVFGPDGKPKIVEACTPDMLEECFDVVFDDGASVIAGGDHLWAVSRDNNKTPGKRGEITVSTTNLFLKKMEDSGRNQRPDCIIFSKGIELPPKRLLIDPYILGAWLGDGASAYGAIYSGGQDIESMAHLGRITLTKKAEPPYKKDFYRIHIEGLSEKLRALNLTNNKHIPEDYLEASLEQRWDLLRGLMDTDGTVSKSGNCSFTNANARIAIEIHHLIQSLGIKSYISSGYNKCNGVTYGPHYQIIFAPNHGDIVFKIKRKQERVKGIKNKRYRNRYVKKVIPVGKRIVKCIQVSGGLYLAGNDLVVTHNSIITNVFFPAWMWITKPHLKFLTFSYAQSLTERDNMRFRNVIMSDVYQMLWGKSFFVTRDTMIKVENSCLGWKIASSIGGTATGERANFLIIDDPNSVKEAESQQVRGETNRWYMEVLPSRVVDPNTTAFITIQQRTNEDDVSGLILSRDMGYEHLSLPMEFERDRKCSTSIGWEDWRTEDGELLWPEVYGQDVVDNLKSNKELSSYAYAGQYQQLPAPRGGGIIKSSWWGLYPKEGEVFDEYGRPVKPLEYPQMDFIIGSVDGAYTEKKQNDPSAMAVFGIYREDNQPRLILMDAWQKRMVFHGTVPVRRTGEMEKEYLSRDEWGLVERVAYTANRFRIDLLLIENKATGITLSQEIRRIFSGEKFSVQLFNPKGDKIARAHSVAHLFENGIISAPNREWATMAIDEVTKFPRGAHDDMVDAIVQALIYLRQTGWALRTNEQDEANEQDAYQGPMKPIYDV